MNKQTYIHQTPGRLRVRTQAIRRNPAGAAAVRALLAGIPHVRSVEANPLTGSVTLRYDPAGVNPDHVLALLGRRGYLEGPAGAVRSVALANRPTGALAARAGAAQRITGRELWGQVVAPKLAEFLVRWMIEQALTAAIAGIL